MRVKVMKRKLIDDGKGLRITIPKSIVDLYQLTPNDKVQWGVSDEKGVFTLKFIKEE